MKLSFFDVVIHLLLLRNEVLIYAEFDPLVPKAE